MKMTYLQIHNLISLFNELYEVKLPFKVSLVIAKNISALQKEIDFFVEQERKLVDKYLERDENGNLIEEQPGAYKIKDDLVDECQQARIDLDNFVVDIELYHIPAQYLEKLDFSPKQLIILQDLIDEQEV